MIMDTGQGVFIIKNTIKKGKKMKKKMFMKVLSLALASTMLLTACGNSAATEKPVSDAPEASEEASTETETKKEYWQMLSEVSDSSELPDWEGEKLEVTVWVAGGTDAVMGSIPETNVTFKELERVTGVSFNLEESYGNGGESVDAKLPKIIASKDYPTVMLYWDQDGQAQELFENGYLADLTEFYDNGDLWGVEYWLPREKGENTLYHSSKSADGKYFGIPTTINPDVTYTITDHTVEEYDADYYKLYGATPKTVNGFGTSQTVWVRDDLLKAVRPEAKTMDEIAEIYEANGTYTKEEIFDVGLKSPEDLYQLLRDLKAEVDTGKYVGLDGKPMEVMYGPNTEADNWDWLYILPSFVLGTGPSSDYFSAFVNDDDASTPLLERGWKNEKMVGFMRTLNTLLDEGIISETSLIDNAATFTEKKENAHYAVFYGNSANSVNSNPSYGDAAEWSYRPVWIDQLPDKTQGCVTAGGVCTQNLAIFKDAVTDEQLEQLVHAYSYIASPVGSKMFIWGPSSAGLFTEDAEGNRTYTDEALVENMIQNKDSEAGFKYGLLKGTCTTQTLFTYGIQLYNLSYKYTNARYLALGGMEPGATDAQKYFNPGILEEYSYGNHVTYTNTAVNTHGYGVKVSEGLKEWWAGRPGFEKQLTKTIASSPENFDAELDELTAYSESVGFTDEALEEFNQKFVEDNKNRLDEAGIVY